MKTRRGIARPSTLWLVLALLATPAPSAAQPARDGVPSEAELDTARERFREGLALEEQGNWAGARRKFEEVERTKATPQVLFHLALCDEKLGALVAALEGYDHAVEAAAEAGEPARAVAETAREHAEALRPRVPRLRVEVTGLEDDDEVQIDGRPAQRGELARGVLLDPGSRRVVVSRDGKVVTEKSVRLAASERATVSLVVAPRPALEPEPPVVASPPPKEEPSGGSRVPALVVGGVGVASLVGAGVTFGLSRAALDEVLLTCRDPDAATGCDPAARASEDEARTLTTASIVLTAVGAACLATGVVLWFALEEEAPAASPASAPSARRAPRRLGVAPSLFGATAHGEF